VKPSGATVLLSGWVAITLDYYAHFMPEAGSKAEETGGLGKC